MRGPATITPGPVHRATRRPPGRPDCHTNWTDRRGPLSLIYLRARVYDPITGQFLTRDPLVQATSAAYSYAGDDPLDRADPTGLCFGPSWLCHAAMSTVSFLEHHAGDILTVAAVTACLAATFGTAGATAGLCIGIAVAAYAGRVVQRGFTEGFCQSLDEDLADGIVTAGTLGTGSLAEAALDAAIPDAGATASQALTKFGFRAILALPDSLIAGFDALGEESRQEG